MGRVSDAEIVQLAYHSVDDFDSESRAVFQRAAGNESITTAAPSEPFPQPAVGVHNDTVYRVSTEVIDSETATSYTFNIDPVSEPVSAAESVRFADLPAVDREKLVAVGFGPGHTEDEFATLDISYLESERKNSALVPTPNQSVIAWESSVRARVSVYDPRPETIFTYQISAEPVAPDVEIFGRQLREEYEVPLTGLSAAEREIVDVAIADRYQVDAGEAPSDALTTLVKRFWNREAAPFETRPHVAEANVAREYIVLYDGQTYRAEVIIDEYAFPSIASETK